MWRSGGVAESEVGCTSIPFHSPSAGCETRQIRGARLRLSALCLLMTACGLLAGGGGATALPGTRNNDGVELFKVVLDTLVQEIKAEGPVRIAVVLEPVADAPPNMVQLQLNLLRGDSSVLEARRTVVKNAALEIAEGIGWEGCPSGWDPHGDKSRCPRGNEAVLAIGEPRKLPPSDSSHFNQGGIPDSTLSINTISTFRDPTGAHTRFMELILVKGSGRWRVLRIARVQYLE